MGMQFRVGLVATCAVLAITSPAVAQDRPWLNAALSPDERANLTVQQMTLDEKLVFTLGYFGSDWEGKKPPAGVRYPVADLRRLVLAIAVLAGGLAHGSSIYPPEVRAHLSLSYTPACTLCHETESGGFGTVTKPFGKSMMARGLVAQNLGSLDTALDALAAGGKVHSFGRGRALRWMMPPMPGFTTTLLLPAALPIE